MIPAIVLAAGRSSRMGRPKALLPAGLDGQSFVERVVRTLLEGATGTVIVVTRDELAGTVFSRLRAWSGTLVRVVVNPDPDRGQLSSLWSGMDAVDEAAPGAPALMVTLVDVPFVQPATVRALIGHWRTTGAPIVRPVFGSRHGHPVIFDRSLFAELRQADPATGAKPVVTAHLHECVDVPVDDEGCIRDFDVPQDMAIDD